MTIVEPSFDTSTPEQLTKANELSVEIQNPINGLPERCRQIFMLSRYEGKKYKEIAALLGISIKTVENQIFKALAVLRKTIYTLSKLFHNSHKSQRSKHYFKSPKSNNNNDFCPNRKSNRL